MSPTEDDLRAALRTGEGDPVDASRAIADGRAVRSQRRTRLLGGAAAAVFVAALATGGALIANNGDNGTTDANSAHRAASAPKGATPSQPHYLPGAKNDPAATGQNCPVSPTHQLLPGGGSPGQFGSGGKLFPKPVTKLVVCGYTTGPTITTPTPGRTVLTGSNAATVVASLENASTKRPAGVCPDYETANQRTLIFLGIDADGSTERQVTATLSGPICRNMVTNGTAVRYAWMPPKAFSASLESLTPNARTQPGISQPGGGNQKHGSPIHS